MTSHFLELRGERENGEKKGPEKRKRGATPRRGKRNTNYSSGSQVERKSAGGVKKNALQGRDGKKSANDPRETEGLLRGEFADRASNGKRSSWALKAHIAAAIGEKKRESISAFAPKNHRKKREAQGGKGINSTQGKWRGTMIRARTDR